MQAQIITIGDELLIGQVTDTNSAFIASCLNEAGISLYQTVCVHDNGEQITSALRQALEKADVVLTTGGLGPTKDDITKKVLCDFFHTTLVEDPAVRAHVLSLYSDRPQVLNALTATQWLVPQNATILPNRVGSAPLMVFTIPHTDRPDQYVCCMPGVPYEMEIAMREQIIPFLQSAIYANRVGTLPIIHRTCIVYGIPESQLALQIVDWEDALPPTMHLAYLPKDGMIRLRLSSYGEATAQQMDERLAALYPLIEPWLIAKEDQPIEVLVGNRLRALGATISTAESCTGGRLAALLNAHPGSSAFYYGSVVSYDNSIKEKILAVHHRDLETYGAVSEQVVRQMAEAVRCLLHTDYAIATSGIAGPDGGTPDKPVGTVWIAWATPQGTTAQCFHLGKIRTQITQRACTIALIRLLQLLSTLDS